MMLTVFILAVFGIVEIIIQGKPTEPIRKLFSLHPVGKEFIHCPLCLGFWVGMGSVWLLWDVMSFAPWYLAVFLSGCMGSGISYFLHNMVTPPSFGEEE